jgi:hypothetical protein
MSLGGVGKRSPGSDALLERRGGRCAVEAASTRGSQVRRAADLREVSPAAGTGWLVSGGDLPRCTGPVGSARHTRAADGCAC